MHHTLASSHPNPNRRLAGRKLSGVSFMDQQASAAASMRLPRPLYYSCLISALMAGSARAATPPVQPSSVSRPQRELPGPRTFRIPESDASDSLKVFSLQAGTALVYVVEHVRGIRTNSIEGRLLPREALERLVANTNLTVFEDDLTGALMIKRRQTAAPSPRTSNSSPSESDPNPALPMTSPRASALSPRCWHSWPARPPRPPIPPQTRRPWSPFLPSR
jgi:hypothetical protein